MLIKFGLSQKKMIFLQEKTCTEVIMMIVITILIILSMILKLRNTKNY